MLDTAGSTTAQANAAGEQAATTAAAGEEGGATGESAGETADGGASAEGDAATTEGEGEQEAALQTAAAAANVAAAAAAAGNAAVTATVPTGSTAVTGEVATTAPATVQASATTPALDAAVRMTIGDGTLDAAETTAVDAELSVTTGKSTEAQDGQQKAARLAALAAEVAGTEADDSGDGQTGAKSLTAPMPKEHAGPTPAPGSQHGQARGAATAAAATATAHAAAVAAQATEAAPNTQVVAATASGDQPVDAGDAVATEEGVQLKGAQVRAGGEASADAKARPEAPQLPTQASERAVAATQAAPGHGGAGPAAHAHGESAAAASKQGATQAPAETAAPAPAPETASTATQQTSAADKPQVAARAAQFGATLRETQERIEHIAEQLSTRLRLSHAAGGSEVRLQLRPRELGEVQVQMTIREGVVAAAVLVDKPDTGRLLQNNLDELKRSLESQGLDIQHFTVDVRDGGTGAWDRHADAVSGNGARGNGSDLAGAANATDGLNDDVIVTPEDHHDGNVSVLA